MKEKIINWCQTMFLLIVSIPIGLYVSGKLIYGLIKEKRKVSKWEED